MDECAMLLGQSGCGEVCEGVTCKREANEEIADLKAENKRLDDIISRRRINCKDFEDADTGNLQLQLTAERAKSAKLFEALKDAVRIFNGLVRPGTIGFRAMVDFKKILSEYKAGK